MSSLKVLHENVLERIDSYQQRAISAHNMTTNILAHHFVVCDVVVICKPVKDRHKLFL